MRTRLALVALTLVGTSALAVACGDDSGSKDTVAATTAAAADTTAAESATTAAPAATEANIVIKSFAFTVTPSKVGTITVRNEDSAPHTVTADDGSFSVDVDPGATATFTVDKAGTYAFHCNIHSSMTGSLVVS